MEYAQAKAIAEKYVDLLRPFAKRIEIAGSIRRECAEVNSIEICMIRDAKHIFDLRDVVESWYKIKGRISGRYCQRILPEGIKIDLFFCSPENWGINFAVRTGSIEWVRNNLALAWARKGYRSIGSQLTPVSGFDEEIGAPIPIYEELDVFKFLKIDFVEPKDRK